MPEPKDDEKRMPGRMLRLPQAVWDGLDAAANAAGEEINAQKLLHRAARAVIRCHEEFGSVPMDMRLIQAPHPSAAGATQQQEPSLGDPARVGKKIDVRLKDVSLKDKSRK